MVVASVGDLLLHLRSHLADAAVVVVEVAPAHIVARAGISGGDGGAMLQDVESPVVVNNGITLRPRAMPDLINGRLNGREGDVSVTIVTTEPSNEVTDVEIHEE